MLLALARCLRPKQHVKNGLVFAPAIFAARTSNVWILDPHTLLYMVELFALLSLMAGCTYIINDFVDLESDRRNPDKRRRPMASGEINPKLALSIAVVVIPVVLIYVYLAHGLWVGTAFLSYLCVTVCYSFFLKRLVILDIMTIAGLFVIRAEIGRVALGVVPSMWFLSCVGSVALFVAAAKRHHEHKLVEKGIVGSGHARAVIGQYNEQLLLIILTVATVGALFTYTLFATEEAPPGFGWSVPFVVYGVFRFLYLALVRGVGGTPEVTLLRDPPLLATVGLWLATLLIVYYRYRITSDGF